MLASSLAAWATGCGGCREQPSIVIHFEPRDLGSRDLAAVPATPAVVPDAQVPGAAARPAAPARGLATGDGPCSSDAECATVRADCCGCSAGGRARAVLKAMRAGVERSMDERCREAMCIQMLSNDPSCGGRPACRGKRCVLVDRQRDRR